MHGFMHGVGASSYASAPGVCMKAMCGRTLQIRSLPSSDGTEHVSTCAPPGPAQEASACGAVLRAPPPGQGPFMLSRRPIPDLIDSLTASARTGRAWALGLAGAGCSLLALGVLRGGWRPGRGGGLRERAAQAARETRLRVLEAFGRRRSGASSAGVPAAERQPEQLSERQQ